MNIRWLQDISSKTPLSSADTTDKICDERFIDQLKEVQNLKSVLFEEKVKFDPNQLDSIDLGSLNNLRFGARGRMATLEEWKLLDGKLSALTTYLDADLRQKIRIRELDDFFEKLPLCFLLAALATTLYYFLYGSIFAKDSFLYHASYLVSVIIWTVAQGGLGACAYLGTKAAMKRTDRAPSESLSDSVDITDRSILKIRVILGCLFGALIGLPIANLALTKLTDAIYSPDGRFELTDFVLMILPFLVGFSTNLVLAILERCIDSVRTFFGIVSK